MTTLPIPLLTGRVRRMLRHAALILLAPCLRASAQGNFGEVTLQVSDTSGTAVPASVELVSEALGYHKTFTGNDAGALTLQHVPFGIYGARITHPGFAPATITIAIHTSVPAVERVRLNLASVATQVTVSAADTLIDPKSASSHIEIGSAQIQTRVNSLPGRSVQDLVVSQPGWLYEGNAVLHPRGSEYQTQFVLDGIPLTDNRSPGMGPEIEADSLDSIGIYTAGFPAEFGRKLGGVVELNTRQQTDPGLHGHFVLFGGSYDTASAFGQLQAVRGKSTLNLSADGSMTDHFLNPVVPQNYTNTGTTGDFAASFEQDPTDRDRLRFSIRHAFSRYLVPNELPQQQAGQVQNGDTVETLGTVNYQRILSPDKLLVLAGMVRDNATGLESNTDPTPIAAFQHNSFREGYFKGTFSLHHGHHEIKAGLESDATFLGEHFRYTVTAPQSFDPGTPTALRFDAHRPDLEQSAFAEDTVHARQWTVSAGLRWDHYQLLLNQNAVSPRISVGYSIPSRKLLLHASFDRVFQTPAFENLLLSSSPGIGTLSQQFLRLPVQPSRGNDYEAGLTQNLFDRMRLDLNVYRRNVGNYADDDPLLNTGVSYPVAFRKAVIYGAEGKLEVVHLGRLTGFVSYSYMVGNVWLPVTGGLFLGDDASAATSQVSGHFPDSQDQRNTLATRFRYALGSRLWVAAGSSFGSGLPFDYGGTANEALALYGPDVVNRLNFARGRIRPAFLANASLGFDLYTSDKAVVRVQADGTNLNNRLDVIDFGGLFSGNAIGPARSYTLRLSTNF